MILDVAYSFPLTGTTTKRIVDYINSFDKLILYHGTTTKFKDRILSEGLKSRKHTGNSTWSGVRNNRNESLESNLDLIYVGNLFKARHLGVEAPERYGGDLILFKLLLDRNDLLPDEDSEENDGIKSLASLGAAAIFDHISPERIVGYSKDIPSVYGMSNRISFSETRDIQDEVFSITSESYRNISEVYGN